MFSMFTTSPVTTSPTVIPPGLLSAANNGLSVNPAGTVVLGQNVGEAGNPAGLFSIREIPMLGQQIVLKGPLQPVLLQEEIRIFDSAFISLNAAYLSSFGPGISLNNLNGGQIANIGFVDNGGGQMYFSINDGNTFIKIDIATGQIWITQSPNDSPPNLATFAVVGSIGCTGALTGRRNIVTPIASPEVFDPSFSRTIYTNEATANLDIDISNGNSGADVTGAIVQAGTVTLTPAAGDTITIAGSTGAAGAPATSVVPGSVITLVKHSATGWLATSFTGVWTV